MCRQHFYCYWNEYRRLPIIATRSLIYCRPHSRQPQLTYGRLWITPRITFSLHSSSTWKKSNQLDFPPDLPGLRVCTHVSKHFLGSIDFYWSVHIHPTAMCLIIQSTCLCNFSVGEQKYCIWMEIYIDFFCRIR